MNKKGQQDIGKVLGSIFGIFILFIFVISIFSILNNTLTQDQCKPYQEEAERLRIQAELDNETINQLNNLLNQCKFEYSELANSTITRKDFEEVKGYFNFTQNEISTINKKIDSMDRIYNFYTIKNYSFALNFVLAIEVLSLLLWKSEFALAVFNWIRKKKKPKKEKSKGDKNA